jgi:hypothetical protein
MNPLEEYFEHNPGRLIHKWSHYLTVYHRHFERFRDLPVTLLELGVSHGGSLQMWKHYLGERARIVGVDCDDRCAAAAEDRIDIIIGDQGDREFLARLARDLGAVDVVVDDGGHRVDQQIASFEHLFPIVRDGGVYAVEDLHTSYWHEYGGGVRRSGTFVEFAKDLIDELHAWHSRDWNTLPVSERTRSIRSIHFYDSLAVLEKDDVQAPELRETGSPLF